MIKVRFVKTTGGKKCGKCGADSTGGSFCNLCDILASRRAPGAKSDREFLAGRGTLASQFEGEEYYVDKITKRATSLGYRPGINDVYLPNLARFAGDPQAFVPATGGRGHVQKVCEKLGTSCEGMVTVVAREPLTDPHEKKVPLANDIIRNIARARIKENPDVARMNPRDLRDDIIAKHGPPTN